MIRLFGGFRKQRKESGPPEPGFLEKPKGFQKVHFSIRDFFEKRWVKWSLLLTVALAAIFLFSLPNKKSKTSREPVVLDEKRVIMTTASMERVIDASAKTKTPVEAERPSRVSERKKRKFDSAIAVFVAESESGKTLSLRRDMPEEPKLGLPSGTKIPVLLQDRVFSFNVEAPVLAVLAKDFLYQEKVVIPKDSKFLGEANIVKSLDRINVRFHLLVLPDGREIRVQAMALSEDGAAGIKGKVEKHTDMKILKAIGESALSVGTLFLGGGSRDPFSLEDQLRLNVAQNLSDEAKRNLRDVKIEKSVTAEAYKPVYVLLLDSV